MEKQFILGISALVVSAILFSGCSNKIPDAEKPKWEKNSALVINKEFILAKEFSVPKDPYLKNENWTYQITAEKQKDNYFKNDEIVKTFIIAHNAEEIILVGRDEVIRDYRNYFIKNQVSADIKLQPVNPISKDFNKVNILFFRGIKD